MRHLHQRCSITSMPFESCSARAVAAQCGLVMWHGSARSTYHLKDVYYLHEVTCRQTHVSLTLDVLMQGMGRRSRHCCCCQVGGVLPGTSTMCLRSWHLCSGQYRRCLSMLRHGHTRYSSLHCWSIALPVTTHDAGPSTASTGISTVSEFSIRCSHTFSRMGVHRSTGRFSL